jgi:hypothetical protein
LFGIIVPDIIDDDTFISHTATERLPIQPNIKAIIRCKARLLDGAGNILSVTRLTSNSLLLPNYLLDIDFRGRPDIRITKQQPYSSATSPPYKEGDIPISSRVFPFVSGNKKYVRTALLRLQAMNTKKNRQPIASKANGVTWEMRTLFSQLLAVEADAPRARRFIGKISDW